MITIEIALSGIVVAIEQDPVLCHADALGAQIAKLTSPHINLIADTNLNRNGSVKSPVLDGQHANELHLEMACPQSSFSENNDEVSELWTPINKVPLMVSHSFFSSVNEIKYDTYLLFDGACSASLSGLSHLKQNKYDPNIFLPRQVTLT